MRAFAGRPVVRHAFPSRDTLVTAPSAGSTKGPMIRREEKVFPYRAQVLERAFAILDMLAESAADMSLADMHKKSSLNKSTFYRLLRTLERYRFVEKDPGTKRYRLGGRFLELGVRIAARFDLVTTVRPYLEKLSQKTGETAHLGILADGDVVSIAVVDGRHALRMSVTVGSRVPANCSALGKAILALRPPQELDFVLSKYGHKARTRQSITQRAELLSELTRIRARGFAIDDEELEEGLRCVAAPVQDYSGRVVAAISIAGPSFRITKKSVSTLASYVAGIATEFSRSLGYQPGVAPSDNGNSSIR